MRMSVGPSVKHAMIVTEYMENGALDRYLRVRAKPKSQISFTTHFVYLDYFFVSYMWFFLSGPRRRVYLLPAGGHAARHRCRHEVPL